MNDGKGAIVISSLTGICLSVEVATTRKDNADTNDFLFFYSLPLRTTTAEHGSRKSYLRSIWSIQCRFPAETNIYLHMMSHYVRGGSASERLIAIYDHYR